MNKIPPKPNDKRTRRYKEWVAKYENQSTGVGDTVEKITKATGIKAAVDGVFDALGKDCGCDERKKTLNEMFPYNKPNCLTQEEHSFLTDFYSAEKTQVTAIEQTEILAIYNRVFNVNDVATNCGSCFASKLNKLKSLFDKYE
tara:strand:- start:2416 stop:2844 length:429 start_codon:yes stop_codon:yes gene_type:complete